MLIIIVVGKSHIICLNFLVVVYICIRKLYMRPISFMIVSNMVSKSITHLRVLHLLWYVFVKEGVRKSHVTCLDSCGASYISIRQLHYISKLILIKNITISIIIYIFTCFQISHASAEIRTKVMSCIIEE